MIARFGLFLREVAEAAAIGTRKHPWLGTANTIAGDAAIGVAGRINPKAAGVGQRCRRCNTAERIVNNVNRVNCKDTVCVTGNRRATGRVDTVSLYCAAITGNIETDIGIAI